MYSASLKRDRVFLRAAVLERKTFSFSETRMFRHLKAREIDVTICEQQSPNL